jgi:hypothetical protein
MRFSRTAADGALPPEWSTLTNLVILELTDPNRPVNYTGSATIPPSWTALTALQVLDVHDAALGFTTLPTYLSTLPSEFRHDSQAAAQRCRSAACFLPS